jgi:polar amino acid transport system substrate-binding protein
MSKFLVCFCLPAMLVTCGGEARAPEAPSIEKPPATPAEQVALGQKLYAEKCASCHGANGEGDDAPRIVGLRSGALPLDPRPSAQYRKGQFKTAGDVAAFVVANMPPDEAGRMTEQQYLAILAFDLKANGIGLTNKLDLAMAKTLTIPR